MPEFDFFAAIRSFEGTRLDLIANEIVETVRDEFVENFDSASFDGTNWPEVKRNQGGKLGKYSKYAGNPPLVETGELRQALVDSVKGHTWGDMSLEVNNDYSSYHQFGTDKIPARPFMGWTPKLEDKIKSIVEKAVKDSFPD